MELVVELEDIELLVMGLPHYKRLDFLSHLALIQ